MSDIACCGVDCAGCPARLALENDDDELRRRTAAQWSRAYQAQISPEQIACKGCRSAQGPYFSHCGECAVRACVQEKGWDNCAPCPEFPCDDLADIHNFAPEARKALEGLRSAD